jgi:hypothetical protein
VAALAAGFVAGCVTPCILPRMAFGCPLGRS